MRRRWHAVRAPVILALAATVVVLGTIGFRETNPEYTRLDAIYHAVQLFGFGGGVDSPPWELEVARFLGPLLVGYAAVQGLIVLLRQQLQLLGLRLLRRDHVVVAGLGNIGFRMAVAFHDAGERVIGLDRDAANPALVGCRERGIGTFGGDATDPDVLDKARVDRARVLVVACGSDGVNVDVAGVARALSGSRPRGVLTALTHVDDPAMRRALEARVLSEPPHSAFRLQAFNPFETAAQVLVEEHRPFSADGGPAAETWPSPSVLLVTEGPIAEALALSVTRLWLAVRPSSAGALRLTVAGPRAEAELERILGRHAGLARLCEISAWQDELLSPATRTDPRVAGADSIYVSLTDEAAALATCVSLASASRSNRATTVLAVADEGTGAAAMLHDDPLATRIETFGILSHALRPDIVLRGLNETLARTMHATYLRGELSAGVTLVDNPSLISWEALPESLKESSRRFADGIGPKLEAVGCVALPNPLIDPDGELTAFTEPEIELLARIEHDRWSDDLRRDGWTPGEAKDAAARVHRSLVPWEELSEAEREKDRVAVRDLPRMLAAAGYEICRLEGDDG